MLWYVGFTGILHNLSVMPTESMLSVFQQPDFVCTRSVTTGEWQELVHNIDWASFRKEGSIAGGECCDIGGVAIKVTAGAVVHHVSRQHI
ncbi:hypothetical protein GCM10027347_02810 [Larkinella harenae]